MSSDIYGIKDPPVSNRKKRVAVSQRRDEYLRAIGEELDPHHHHHRRHHRSFRRKAVFFGLGVLALLAFSSITFAVLLATRHGLAVDGYLPKNNLLLDKAKIK